MQRRRGAPISEPASVPAEPEAVPSLPDLPHRAQLPVAPPPVTVADVQISELVRGALEVQSVRIEQLARILETQSKQMAQTMEKMQDLIAILEEVWANSDERVEKLGSITAALIKLYQVEDERQS